MEAIRRPALESQYSNPGIDSLRSSAVCGNQTWMAHESPPWAWTQLLAPGSEFEAPLVAAVGTAVTPKMSGSDWPFTHPFGGDYEFFIAVDPQYDNLLAANNIGGSAKMDGEYVAAYKAATDPPPQGLNLRVRGILGVEIDSGFVPPDFRVQAGDRVAVFGRLISDCGHDDFHTEIHPPLAFVAARTRGDDRTDSTLISRPFLVSQQFSDGAMLKHLEIEIKKCLGDPEYCPFPGVPCSLQVEAHPHIFTVPFQGKPSFDYILRPPAPRRTLADRLIASYNFTVRTGVNVQLTPVGPVDEGLRISVDMDASRYPAAPLPNRHDSTFNLAALAGLGPSWVSTVAQIFDALPNPVLDQGIKTDQYDPLQAGLGNLLGTTDVAEIGNLPHFTVDNRQVFPVSGWINLEWARGNAVWGAGWEDLGGAITGPLSVVTWGPNRLDIFGVGPGGTVQHYWYDPTIAADTNHGWGAGWEDLGGAITGPLSVVTWGPNRLDIFGVAQSKLSHLWYG
jgi:hypothetical protein